jgi:hypothetical protein
MGKEPVVLVAVLDVCRGIASWCVSALWSRLRRRPLGVTRRRPRTYALGGRGLNYDALSYAQNFDDGGLGDCECDTDFTARFAPAQLPGARRPSLDQFCP